MYLPIPIMTVKGGGKSAIDEGWESMYFIIFFFCLQYSRKSSLKDQLNYAIPNGHVPMNRKNRLFVRVLDPPPKMPPTVEVKLFARQATLCVPSYL